MVIRMNVNVVSSAEIKPHERRASKRYAVRLPVIVRVDGKETAHMTINASSGGLLIRPEVDHAGADWIVRLDIGALAVDVEAVVIGHRPNGTALRFTDAAAGENLALAVAEQVQRSG